MSKENRIKFKALAPILLFIWLGLGFTTNFISSTIAVGLATILAFAVVAWIEYICDKEYDKGK